MQLLLDFDENRNRHDNPNENPNENPYLNENPCPNENRCRNENRDANRNANRNPDANAHTNVERSTLNVELLFVRHPRARRYVLRVNDDGTVRVTVPRWGSKREAREFASAERAWIDRQLAKLAADRARTKPLPLSHDAIAAGMARARRELPLRLRELAVQHGLAVVRVSVRNQRWRWGSCNRAKHICLNWRLVTMPEWVRDYVMIHELMHLKRMDHSPRFWKLVAAACPAYREARAWLRAARSN